LRDALRQAQDLDSIERLLCPQTADATA